MSKHVNYEVNVGSGCGNGSVIVPDNATDEEIRLAILDDLYEVVYEVEVVDKYAIINISREKDGLVDGVCIQGFTGTLEEATQWARATEKANSNRIKVAVIEDRLYSHFQNIYGAKRLDIEKEI